MFGSLVPLIALVAGFTGAEGEFSLYGIDAYGSIFSPAPLFVVVLFIAHGVCAYGLLFAKSWGVQACIMLGYVSAAICVYTMFGGLGGESVTFRLELALLIPYLMKLHKLAIVWSPDDLNAATMR